MQSSTVALLVSLLAAPALAAPAPTAPSVRADDPVKIRDGEQGMRDGTFLPLTLSARIGDQRVMGMGLGGYDTTGGGSRPPSGCASASCARSASASISALPRSTRTRGSASPTAKSNIKPRERDGEVRLALLYQLARRVHLGFDARGRFDLGEGQGESVDMPFDLVAGPVVGATVGKFAFLAQAGGRVAIVNDHAMGGFTALGGVGALY
jgi:hypothetical protein